MEYRSEGHLGCQPFLRVHQPLGRLGVVAASVRLGAIEPRGGRRGGPAGAVPISEQFFAGGRTTHRSYRRDLLGVLGETLLLCNPEGDLCGSSVPPGDDPDSYFLVPVGGNGLEIQSSNNEIRSFVINRFVTGIAVLGGDGNVVAGNYLGPDAGGAAGLVGNSDEGIHVYGATNTVIGGAQDNGTSLVNAADTPDAWDLVFGGDGGYCAVASAAGPVGTYYMSYQQNYGIFRMQLDNTTGALLGSAQVDPPSLAIHPPTPQPDTAGFSELVGSTAAP